jgi:bacterioferritin (cytochrome b1)
MLLLTVRRSPQSIQAADGPRAVRSKQLPSEGIAMPLNDVSYDLLSILQSKLDAVAIYEQYIEDAQGAGNGQVAQLFEQIKQQDEQAADRLANALEQMVKSGQFH